MLNEVRAEQQPPFMKIPEASKATGLSQYFLRIGCKDGSIPHIMCGNNYLINVPQFLKKLEAEWSITRCSECGGVLTYGGNYCPNCGAEIEKNENML